MVPLAQILPVMVLIVLFLPVGRRWGWSMWWRLFERVVGAYSAQLCVIFAISSSRSIRLISSPSATTSIVDSMKWRSRSRSTSSTARPSAERISISTMS